MGLLFPVWYDGIPVRLGKIVLRECYCLAEIAALHTYMIQQCWQQLMDSQMMLLVMLDTSVTTTYYLWVRRQRVRGKY